MKDNDSFHKVVNKGKGGKRGPKQHINEGKKVSQNKFQVLEENEKITRENQSREEGPNEKQKEENNKQYQDVGSQKETMISEMEMEMDQEMTQSEIDLEDQELLEIVDKENLDLEGLLMQGTKGGIDSLSQEECNIIQQSFLWKAQERGLDKGKNIHKQEQRGVKTMKSTPGLATRNPGKKRGKKNKTSS